MKSVKTPIQSALSFKTVFSIHRLIGPCWQKRSVHLQIAVTKTSLRTRAIIPETRSRATTIVQSPHTKTRFTKSCHNFAGKSEVSQSQHAKGTFLCAKAYYYGMHVIYGPSVICDFDRVLTRIIVFKLRILIRFCGKTIFSQRSGYDSDKILCRCAYRKSSKVGTPITFTAAIKKWHTNL